MSKEAKTHFENLLAMDVDLFDSLMQEYLG
jgi:hypothetical protein